MTIQKTSSLNAAQYVPLATADLDAEASTSRHSIPQVEPISAQTVSRNQQARSSLAANLNQAAENLSNLYQQKLAADLQENQHEAAPAINKEICRQTFVLEGMAAALEREQNLKAVITYESIMECIEKNSRTANGPEGSYKRLFSDHALFAGRTLEDNLHLATATFKAYEEVLSNLDADDQEKQYIQLSYSVFKDSVQDLVQEQRKALADMQAGMPEHARAQENLDKAIAVEKLVLSEEIRQDLCEKQTFGNLMRGLVGTIPAMGIASLLHFGYLKNMADDTVTGQLGYDHNNWSQSVGERTAVGGLVTGTAYWGITDAVVPSVTYATEFIGGRPVVPVDPKIIYPDAPKVISENGIPRELSAEEHTQKQQEVEKQRAAFKQAQAAFKIGSVAGDVISYLSFGLAQASRVLLDKTLGIDAQSLDVRAVASAVGSAAMGGVMTYKQLNQTFDGVPTYTLGNPKGKKQIMEGFQRLDLTKSANRRNLLAKITGTTEGLAVSNMFDTAVTADIDASTMEGRLVKALATQAGATAMLHPLFSNTSAGAEVKEAQAQQAVSSGPFAGTKTALHGVMHPDSAHIPHTFQERGSMARKAENVFQVARHGAQLVPQLVVDSIDAVATGVQYAVSTAYNRETSALRAGVSTLPQLRQRPGGYTEPLLS